MCSSSSAAETVTLFRAGTPESRHRVSAVVADAAGRVVRAWGEPDSVVFPRSALKPLQALPLVESGAADAMQVDDAELALALASHTGLPVHVDRVAAWLARLGLTPDDLECGVHEPTAPGEPRRLGADGRPATALHNNCSGKHTGMLATCLHLGLPTRGYSAPEHPLQRLILTTYAEVTGVPETAMPLGIDGCSLPAAAMPLGALARAMGGFAAPESRFTPERAAAIRRINGAWGAWPELIAGPQTFNTDAMRLFAGRVLLKRGAQGVYAGAVPELGLGFAVKAECGSSVAADAMTAVVLRALAVADDRTWHEIMDMPYFREQSWRGLHAGDYRPEGGWPA